MTNRFNRWLLRLRVKRLRRVLPKMRDDWRTTFVPHLHTPAMRPMVQEAAIHLMVMEHRLKEAEANLRAAEQEAA